VQTLSVTTTTLDRTAHDRGMIDALAHRLIAMALHRPHLGGPWHTRHKNSDFRR
jgi:hypothetical protein